MYLEHSRNSWALPKLVCFTFTHYMYYVPYKMGAVKLQKSNYCQYVIICLFSEIHKNSTQQPMSKSSLEVWSNENILTRVFVLLDQQVTKTKFENEICQISLFWFLLFLNSKKEETAWPLFFSNCNNSKHERKWLVNCI